MAQLVQPAWGEGREQGQGGIIVRMICVSEEGWCFGEKCRGSFAALPCRTRVAHLDAPVWGGILHIQHHRHPALDRRRNAFGHGGKRILKLYPGATAGVWEGRKDQRNRLSW